MSRISKAPQEKQSPDTQKILKNFQEKIGKVPNIFQHMAHSEHTLKGYLALSELAEKTTLPPQLREKIALFVAEKNGCDYCLAAHSHIAKDHHLTDEEILAARKGLCKDPKVQAILQFCSSCLKNAGKVTDDDIKNMQKLGVSEKEICDIILTITLNTLTNYFNNVFQCDVDFPKAAKM